MKNRITRIIFVLLLFVILIAQKSSAQFSDCTNLTNETIQINYGDISDDGNIYSYDKVDLNSGLEEFSVYPNSLIANLTNKKIHLTIADLNTLTQLCTSGNYNSANCLAALRMHFAVDNGNIILLFEPVYLSKNQEKGGFNVVQLDNRVYFRKTGEAFTIALNPEILLSSFPAQRDEDAKTCILPLQQICKMYCENFGFNSKINFSIVVNNFRKNNSWIPKIHVVAYMDNIGNNDEINSFLYLGADFGQMDPPNHIVYYPLK